MEKISLELTPQQMFQLHLCVLTRTAQVTIKWANASSDEEQKNTQAVLSFLDNLDAIVQKGLNDYAKETDKKANKEN